MVLYVRLERHFGGTKRIINFCVSELSLPTVCRWDISFQRCEVELASCVRLLKNESCDQKSVLQRHASPALSQIVEWRMIMNGLSRFLVWSYAKAVLNASCTILAEESGFWVGKQTWRSLLSGLVHLPGPAQQRGFWKSLLRWSMGEAVKAPPSWLHMCSISQSSHGTATIGFLTFSSAEATASAVIGTSTSSSGFFRLHNPSATDGVGSDALSSSQMLQSVDRYKRWQY